MATLRKAILYGQKGLMAIEVKSSDRFCDSDLKSLRLFKDEFPVAKCFFLYMGTQELLRDGIRILPLNDFIKFPENYFF